MLVLKNSLFRGQTKDTDSGQLRKNQQVRRLLLPSNTIDTRINFFTEWSWWIKSRGELKEGITDLFWLLHPRECWFEHLKSDGSNWNICQIRSWNLLLPTKNSYV